MSKNENDQRADFVPGNVADGGRDFRVEGNDVRDFIGVDPEYMNYANLTEAPLLTDRERWEYTNQYDHLYGNGDGEVESDDKINVSEDSEEKDEEVDLTVRSGDASSKENKTTKSSSGLKTSAKS